MRSRLDLHLLLAAAEGCGQALVPALLDPGADPDALLRSPPADLPPAIRARFDGDLRATAARWLDDARRIGAAVVTPTDPSFPARLRDAPLRPLVLFGRGALGLAGDAARPAHVAVVGSRTPTPYGIAAAGDFCDALAEAGVVLWSGLAIGIDAVAHRAALEHGTPTVAVLAGGLDRVYPAAHHGLAEHIVAAGGLCLSEAPPGQRPQRGHFPRRNRIIALGVDAVLVVEAGFASGSLHTARFAADAGVPVYAVPGPYTSERSRGCHRLVAQGAGIASDPGELLRELGVIAATGSRAGTAPAAVLHRHADGADLLRALEGGPLPADVVRREAGLPQDRFLAAMLALLAAGEIRQLPGDLLARRVRARTGTRAPASRRP